MNNTLIITLSALMIIGFGSCSSDDNASTDPEVPDIPVPEPNPDPGLNPDPEPNPNQWYKPEIMDTWQWQLQGSINSSYDVDIYDVDLFDSNTQQITSLHNQNKKVICYFSAGTYEDWRDDANEFTASDLGNQLDEWEGERWIDVRSDNVRDIMRARLILAKDKACDGVEPDNVDGYTNEPGFDFTAVDQLDYNIWLASEAHQQGLSIGLKNDLDQVKDLVTHYDFAVNEQCFQYNECAQLSPFIDTGKPVFNAEYQDKYTNEAARDALCLDANNRKFSTLILPLALDDSYRWSCL